MTTYPPIAQPCDLLTGHDPHSWRDGTDGRERRCAGTAARPQVWEAQISLDLQGAAQDLYRGMNEALAETLARVGLAALFGEARLQVEEDLEAGRTPDLLRAFTEAACWSIRPTTSSHPPASRKEVTAAAGCQPGPVRARAGLAPTIMPDPT